MIFAHDVMHHISNLFDRRVQNVDMQPLDDEKREIQNEEERKNGDPATAKYAMRPPPVAWMWMQSDRNLNLHRRYVNRPRYGPPIILQNPSLFDHKWKVRLIPDDIDSIYRAFSFALSGWDNQFDIVKAQLILYIKQELRIQSPWTRVYSESEMRRTREYRFPVPVETPDEAQLAQIWCPEMTIKAASIQYLLHILIYDVNYRLWSLYTPRRDSEPRVYQTWDFFTLVLRIKNGKVSVVLDPKERSRAYKINRHLEQKQEFIDRFRRDFDEFDQRFPELPRPSIARPIVRRPRSEPASKADEELAEKIRLRHERSS